MDDKNERKAAKGEAKFNEKKREAETVRFEEDLVFEVVSDYENRATQRRAIEAQWQLNSNFVLGNQYCFVNVNGAVEDSDREYYWQEREVYNHIAPIVEVRLAKLNRVRPKMSVRPASADENDIKTAKLSSKILDSTFDSLELSSKIGNATYWSEVAGTVFYKISWDAFKGRKVGKKDGKDVFEGQVSVDVCPPYEVFPSSLTCSTIEECESLIHAKAVSVDEIMKAWGIKVDSESLDVVSMSNINILGGFGASSAVPTINRRNSESCALVIERYTRPSAEKPDGELVIVAGGKLLHLGPLPFVIGENQMRDIPFVKQDALTCGACFFSSSMVERAIPVQRAYNAVKNRKHEFLNRIAMGVWAVEDGSVDMDNLEQEGLSPGKILVYRQGSAPPRLLDPGRVPTDFAYEEDRLLSEFVSLSGVSDFMRTSNLPSTMNSGVALQMLIEQDDTRLSVTAENIRTAVKRIAKMVLRLYKQFIKAPRLSRFAGSEGYAEMLCWDSSDISCDDVVFDSDNEINSTRASKQNMMFELLKMGLLHDENGKLSDTARYKILDVLGYGGWESTRDIATLHINRANKEEADVVKHDIAVMEIDDHRLHVNEHTRFVLSADFEDIVKKTPEVFVKMLDHIKEHKDMLVGAVGLENEASEVI